MFFSMTDVSPGGTSYSTSKVRCVNAGAVLHTHSVWGTVLSGLHASRGSHT
jgi:hypothetical protein